MPWAPNYVTEEELAGYLNIDDLDDHPQLTLAISGSSRSIDHHCGRQFGKTDAPEQRTYTARPDYATGYWTVDVDDFQSDAGLAVTVDGDAVATFTKDPANAAQQGRPWTRIAFNGDSEALPSEHPHHVAVTLDVWGWTAVPPPVRQGALLQSSRLFARRNAPFGIAGSPDTGSEMRLLAKLDPDVAVSLRGLVRTRSPR